MLKRIAFLLAAVIAVLVVPAAGATVAALGAFDALYAAGPARPVPAAAPGPHDPAKPTAVVVVGDRGAVVSDALAPYEILAATGRFNVYTVAPHREPKPLTGGLDLVPDFDFAGLATRLGSRAPDLVVVPAFPDVGEPSAEPVTTWLREQAARGSKLLSVCNGGAVLASAGLLDGRPATAHWLKVDAWAAEYPAVRWVRGERFVDDGTVVTTAGILSGIDGTLHWVERLAGRQVAADAAAAIGWRRYGTAVPVHPPEGTPDAAAIVNAGFRWTPDEIGVLLANGVGEVELASVFDTEGQSLSSRTLAVSLDGGPIRSRHGLVFLPRAALASADLDRLLVPGATRGITAPGGPAPEYVHDRPGFPYDTAVSALSRRTDVATARWTAKVLELPADDVVFEGDAWPWLPTALPIALILAGVAAVVVVVRVRRRRLSRAA
ncbi:MULTISPECIES: DJ-1/PfpI family protein [unclassified Amycolatopsis]|uniref:DJ-1/PfpI family protein n=1 Tax=unclassified Amycolatopsis TaxID=2618356 RepID=UPI002875E604|nr:MULTISPECIES: DJ-1/PfpI family protein [unclassified Amycolatopsis]MDS0137145.1 DJ-1/PfpI family protein [Amycolatopsis sp. 505]MDS0143810.1 DJ-1/PfpI family protein [Amycolatopsis sp. CM201R]